MVCGENFFTPVSSSSVTRETTVLYQWLPSFSSSFRISVIGSREMAVMSKSLVPISSVAALVARFSVSVKLSASTRYSSLTFLFFPVSRALPYLTRNLYQYLFHLCSMLSLSKWSLDDCLSFASLVLFGCYLSHLVVLGQHRIGKGVER